MPPLAITPADKQAPDEARQIEVESRVDSLLIRWQQADDSDLKYSVLQGEGIDRIELDKTIDQYEITALSAAQFYQLTLTSVDLSGNESNGIVIDAATLLDNPVLIEVEAFSGKVGLTWAAAQPINAVNQYWIYAELNDFNSTQGLTPKLKVSAGTLQAGLAGLNNGTDYYFAVAAQNISQGVSNAVVTTMATPEADQQGPTIGQISFAGVILQSGSNLTQSDSLSVQIEDPSSVSRVEFYIDDQLLGVDSNGSNTYSQALELFSLLDGDHQLRIKAFDSLENSSEEELPITVALGAPAAPSILKPHNNLTTNKASVTVTGSAPTHTQIQLVLNGTDVTGLIDVSASGQFVSQLELIDGVNAVLAKAQYPDRSGFGNTSNPLNITLDGTIPKIPSGFVARSGELGQISLSWQAPTTDQADQAGSS